MVIFICLLSGFFWSLFDLTRKKTLKKIGPVTILIIFAISQIIFFLIWTLNSSIFFHFQEYLIPGLFLIIISILSAVLFLKSLEISQLSLTIPLLSFTPLFSAIISSILLDEDLLKFQYFGIFIIIIGTMVLYSKSLNFFDILNSFRVIIKNTGAKYMILVSFFWSLAPIIDKICFKYSSIEFHGLIQSLGVFLILILLSKKEFKQELSLILKNYKLISVTMIVGVTATVLQFYAISLTFVSIMESIKRSIGQIFSIIFGKFFFNESITVNKILGVLILSLGIFCILYPGYY
ncbi:DMT family transporter [Rickettsiales bacterium]|nr:DMT family transporter [Rickettsiales bacterium]